MQNSGSKYDLNQLRDYSSIFSRSEANLFMKGDCSSLDYKIDRYDINWRRKKSATYLSYLKHIYLIVEKNYQNEYVFKNSFLNKWLLKQLGESSSRIFSEFRVGSSIADLVMFNGKSKVFEIKSDLDSNKRLEVQLENYKKAFNEIYIVVPFSKLEEYTGYDPSVGIITYDHVNFSVEREATTNWHICADTIMHILRTAEYKSIVKAHYGYLPDMTSFTMFETSLEMIKKIPVDQLNYYFILHMKRRSENKGLSLHAHKELNQLSLALNLNLDRRNKLIQNLQVPIKT